MLNVNKFKLTIIPYILLLFVLAIVIIKIRDIRLIPSSATDTLEKETKLINKEEWNNLSSTIQKEKSEKALIIYDINDITSVNTYKNVKYVLNSVGVEIVGVQLSEQKKYQNIFEYDNMIICIDDLENLNYTSSKLENWVKEGHGIFFTVPLLSNNGLKENAGLIGISDPNNIETIEYNNIIFEDDYLIGAKGKEFGEITINGTGLKVKLNENVTIHATTSEEDGTPIIWNVPYGNGHVSVCNANMLADKVCRGIIMASYSDLHNEYVYPVINSAMYCIDDFPSPIPTGYNQTIYRQYSCNMEDFYFNIWWPKMKNLVEKYGIKYTGLLIQTYEDKVTPPFNNTAYLEQSKYYANQLLESGGELGIHGYNHQSLALEGFEYRDEEVDYNYWNSLEDMWDSLKSAISYGKSIAPNSDIKSYVAPSNIISSYVWEEMEKNIEDLKV